ncbi:MAG: hypothetical protein JSU01_21710, partial [Bacteroidetes bacterium]|nr:hypothetical protein [Bacteroidota bacterium]
MKNVNIKHISSLHSNALASLVFYEQEVHFLTKRLEEIAAKNTGHEIAPAIEHFQNEFIIHSEKIDELKHAFHQTQHQLQAQLLDTAGYAEEDTLDLNEDLYNQFLTE